MSAHNRDFIAELDAAVGCQQCGGQLGDSPSDDFCGELCQARWAASRAVSPAAASAPVRLHDPETCGWCIQRRRRTLPQRHSVEFVVRPDIQRFRNALQRDLQRMGQAVELPENWAEWFADVTLTDWQAEVLRHHARRYCAQLGRTMTAFASVAQQLQAAAQAAEEVGRAWVSAWNSSATPIVPIDDLRRPPRSIDEVLEESRRERALQLRRNRNTGPGTSSRVPRTINPRRSR